MRILFVGSCLEEEDLVMRILFGGSWLEDLVGVSCMMILL